MGLLMVAVMVMAVMVMALGVPCFWVHQQLATATAAVIAARIGAPKQGRVACHCPLCQARRL